MRYIGSRRILRESLVRVHNFPWPVEVRVPNSERIHRTSIPCAFGVSDIASIPPHVAIVIDTWLVTMMNAGSRIQGV